jgi:hypothetical protein
MHIGGFGLRVAAEGLGSQIENHETHTEILQIYLAGQRGSQSGPASLRVLDLLIIKGIMIESPMLAPSANQCWHNMTSYL